MTLLQIFHYLVDSWSQVLLYLIAGFFKHQLCSLDYLFGDGGKCQMTFRK